MAAKRAEGLLEQTRFGNGAGPDGGSTSSRPARFQPEPAEPGPREPVADESGGLRGRTGHLLRLGGFVHSVVHPRRGTARLLLPQESSQTTRVDLDHVPDGGQLESFDYFLEEEVI